MQILYDLIQSPPIDLEKCAIFLAEVQDQSKDDEHFWEGILGSLKIFLFEPS